MMLEFHSKVTIKKLNKMSDERGWLAEIFRKDSDKLNPAMAYVSFTKAGIVRGPHEHKEQTDNFVFCGPGNVEFHIWENQQHATMVVGEDNPSIIIVPPGVVHGYKALSDSFSFNLPDKLYKGRNKKKEVDEIRWENNPDSPYKID